MGFEVDTLDAANASDFPGTQELEGGKSNSIDTYMFTHN
jgi:hypothetical protein